MFILKLNTKQASTLGSEIHSGKKLGSSFHTWRRKGNRDGRRLVPGRTAVRVSETIKTQLPECQNTGVFGR